MWPSTKTIFEGKFNRVIMQWEGLKDVLLSNASSSKSKYHNAKYNFYNKENHSIEKNEYLIAFFDNTSMAPDNKLILFRRL